MNLVLNAVNLPLTAEGVFLNQEHILHLYERVCFYGILKFDLHLCLLVISSTALSGAVFFGAYVRTSGWTPAVRVASLFVMTKRKMIVAVHGAGLQASFFGGLAPHVTGWAFKALTLPGHEARNPRALLADIAAMSAWLRSEIETLPEEYDIALLGHSMGALAALEAADHPRVSALILTGAAQRMPVSAELLQAATDDPSAAAALICKWGIARQHPQAETLRRMLLSIMQATPPQALAHDLAACDRYDQAAMAAARVQKPALVLAGDADKMTPVEGAQALADLLPQGVFAVLADTGHMSPMEKPFEIAAEISNFLGA